MDALLVTDGGWWLEFSGKDLGWIASKARQQELACGANYTATDRCWSRSTG